MTKPAGLVEVAVDAPLNKPLVYLLPDELKDCAKPGMRVIVPLARRKVTGYIVGFPDQTSLDRASLRKVQEVVDQSPLMDPSMLELLKWAAGYYHAPLAEVIKTALPAGINVSSKRSLTITERGRSAACGEGADSLGLTERDLAALELLFKEGKAAVSAGAGKKKKAAVSAGTAKKLASLGLAVMDDEIGRPRVAEKSLTVIEPLASTGEEDLGKLERKAPRQAMMLKRLLQQGPLPLSELRPEFKDPARLARSLEKAGLVKRTGRRQVRDPFTMDIATGPPPEKLMPEQEQAIKEVEKAVEAGVFKSFLLRGVTGSGKTEVYIRAINKAFEAGRGAIMLVPEIALTPQLVTRLRQRFPPYVLAVLHSGLSPGERYDEWWRIKRGQARIVAGARSAVFAPVRGLGLIVVDEEQDSAYKQDHGFMYNARDLALMRAREAGAPALLGSATPSMETENRASGEKGCRLLTLSCRVDHRPLPEIEVVDMRLVQPGKRASLERESPVAERIKERDRLTGELLISSRMREALEDSLSRNEQAIMFINRRGSASFMLCFDCGLRFTCPNCEVGLVHHRRPTAQKVDQFYGEPAAGGYMLCHYCGFHAEVPEVCPRCRGVRLRAFGSGTEEVEDCLARLFPGARLLRMDSDAMAGRESWHRCLDRILRREVDIIVGTQMVAKGHDLPGVTLAGVLLADMSLNMPDFRASERTFQMLTQVAGRTGRGDAPGKVIVQTFQPEHYAIRMAVEQNYEGFVREELRVREALWYPPFSRLANFRVQARDEKIARKAAQELGRAARRSAGSKAFSGKVRVLGPAPAPIPRIRGKSRWMLLVKADSPRTMGAFKDRLMESINKKKPPPGVTVELDRDPLALL